MRSNSSSVPRRIFTGRGQWWNGNSSPARYRSCSRRSSLCSIPATLAQLLLDHRSAGSPAAPAPHPALAGPEPGASEFFKKLLLSPGFPDLYSLNISARYSLPIFIFHERIHLCPALDTTRIGIIGLGYVGLPLAVEFSKKKPTIGFDLKAEPDRRTAAASRCHPRSHHRGTASGGQSAFHNRD